MDKFNPDKNIIMITASQLIASLRLNVHPEGGYYLETYRSGEMISMESLPPRFGGERPFSTAIYFLLKGNQYSALHRIKSDEIWHFYHGVGLHLYLIHPDGRGEVLKLGNDPDQGYSFQQVVPAGCWFGARPVSKKGYSFVGCTVAPGFDFGDFELANRKELLIQFPGHAEWIIRLTK